MKPTLELRIGQQLAMTPQLQQAIRLLQLSNVDLRAEILTAIEINPLLEIKEDSPSEEETVDFLEENDNDEFLDGPVVKERDWGKSHYENLHDPIETLNGTPLSLRDHLFWQMQLTPFTETDKLIAAAIIDSINPDGFLTTSLEDIIATLKPNIEADIPEVEAVLHRIQQFDPIGVGSRNLEECLQVQIKHMPSSTPWHHQAQMLITHHLMLLSKHDYNTLRRRLDLSKEELQEVINLIQKLNPKPGNNISDRIPEYITPDVTVRKKNKEWVVELNKQWLPQIQINHDYAQASCFRQQLQEAKWLLKSIESRHDTLLKVAKAITVRQTEFLEKGPEFMKPLILQEIADELGMHESTISRITTQKYINTPRGNFELKYFFSGHINKGNGMESSSTSIRALIKKLISEENSKKPLSDSKIAKLLSEKKITIARRTIAKYREEMNILPSNERKQLI